MTSVLRFILHTARPPLSICALNVFILRSINAYNALFVKCFCLSYQDKRFDMLIIAKTNRITGLYVLFYALFIDKSFWIGSGSLQILIKSLHHIWNWKIGEVARNKVLYLIICWKNKTRKILQSLHT